MGARPKKNRHDMAMEGLAKRLCAQDECGSLLQRAGFTLKESDVWTRDEGDGVELQVAADAVDYPPPTDPGAPVLVWSLFHGRPDGEEERFATLGEMLESLAKRNP